MDIFQPVRNLADYVTYGLLAIPRLSHAGESISYFIYDSIRISSLLFLINYLMAVTRHYIPIARIRHILTSRKWYGLDYLLAALFGVITPFCSCSSIPLFIGFLGSGIPLGVTLAFLITSPLVNEASLAVFPAVFGLKFTIAYNLIGIAVGMLGGYVIQKMKMEKYVEPEFLKLRIRTDNAEISNYGKRELARLWLIEGWSTTRNVLPYVIIGVSVGALIHGFIPIGFFERYLRTNELLSIPLATLIGIPIYANSVSVLPVMEAMVSKGVPIGTAIAFMTATVTLSIPEALILRKVMKPKLLLAFFAVTAIGIMMTGYLMNFLF